MENGSNDNTQEVTIRHVLARGFVYLFGAEAKSTEKRAFLLGATALPNVFLSQWQHADTRILTPVDR